MQSLSSDFDFLFGSWNVHHKRMARCHEWVEFDGICTVYPMLGGAANIDDNILEWPEASYRAASIRSFDRTARKWSIWWLDGRFPDRLTTPVVGGFLNRVGEFYADDTLAGRSIRVRFRWTKIDSETPRWEQAFSDDNGTSWETNWIMEFRRQ